MKFLFMRLMVILLLVCVAVPAGSREKKEERPHLYQPIIEDPVIDIPGYRSPAMMTTAAADTYWTVWYDFETEDWQGWTQFDNTAQAGLFFHVDDFAGLGGGSFGRLVAIEGQKSMWCGVKGDPGNLYTCSWESSPGYGNNWDQSLIAILHPNGPVTWSYRIVCDTEAPYDYVEVGFDDFNGRKVLATYEGVVDTTVSHVSVSAGVCTKLFYHFMSDGAWSDQDGNYETDGACIIDNVSLTDLGGLIDYEDFESYDVGETSLGLWYAMAEEGFGIYSGLSVGLSDPDPCNSNFSTVVTFFHGSPYPSAEYPGLFNTPFCAGAGGIEDPCQDEYVISPPIDLTRYSTGRDELQDASILSGELSGLNSTIIRFARYVDLPFSNLVYTQWAMRSVKNGCPGQWYSDPYVYYYPSAIKEWETYKYDVNRFLESDTIQIALGVRDMCSAWYGMPGYCSEHTPSPWYDNVRVYRHENDSPSWAIRRMDLFQDTFPQEVSGSMDPMEAYCRADMANDIAPGDQFDRIDPGDSVVVTVSAPFAGGLDTLGTGEARVYFHCDVTFLGPDGKPDLFGPVLEGTYGSYISDDGDWTILLCEPAATSAGNIAPDKYCIDLNDSLFTRGYMVEYYFKAYDLAGGSSTWPSNAETVTPSLYFGGSNLPEFTCLPTLRTVPGPLYVDDCDGWGTFEGTSQVYYDWTFRAMVGTLWEDFPDRYDVNYPLSGSSNGVGAYVSVTDASSIFCTAYETVVFDSGDLYGCTVSEGTELSDKSNDAQLLVDWMNISEHKVGLLVMGDQIASDLSGSASSSAAEFFSTCGVTLENLSYFNMTGGLGGGGIATPEITGVPGGPYDGLSYFVSGGCPRISGFDVLEVTGPGEYALQYPDYGSGQYYAGIYTDQLNDAGQPLRTVWVGHCFKDIRTGANDITVRKEFLEDTWELFENGICVDLGRTDTEIPKVTSLSDNFPNPFNPATRLSFGLAKKGHVSMRVYDVAGRLVRVLVDDVREAGSYEVVWDGTNDGGRSTASGIYFCRMEATDYERTLKMVQLR